MFNKFDHKKNQKLANFSTMKVGGIAKYIVYPKTIQELQEVLRIIKRNKLKYFILGNGSNVLFADEGFDGVIIKLKYFDQIEQYGEMIEVGAGINMFALNNKLKNMGLNGLEWSYGIPATLGGMIVGNSGCFGHEISEYVEEVLVYDNNDIKRLERDEIKFEYRNSSLRDTIVLSVKLKLKEEKCEKIEKNMCFFLNKKKESQPCDFPSLGSVFKIVQTTPPIYPAKLIDNLGMKGVKIGGAMVSQKHAGFIVNNGDATSKDIVDLIAFLEKKLAENGVFVEREIIIL